jgi:tetratricopeptide (TPR) repeat protein
MCRNVLIYFNHEELVRVLGRVESAMQPDGYLFVGGSESLWQRSDRFQLTRVGSAFAYRLLAAPAAQERRRAVTAVDKDMRRPSTIASLRGAAEVAAAAGDFTAAAHNLRQATHIDPDQPVLHFQLALCLERAGQPEAARLALEASRSAIARCDEARVEAALEGFRPHELEQEIERRLRGTS